MTSFPSPAFEVRPADYLAMERAADERHEFVQGEIFAMTGASRRHNLINGNTFAALHAQLSTRPCEIYSNDMRLKINASGDYVYPDIVAVCDTPQLEDDYLDTLLNPTLIIEVLSPFTEAYDRGTKFSLYRQLDSLREYLLVDQDKVQIEQYQRRENHAWLLSECADLHAVLELPAIGCRLPLAEVYAKVDFKKFQG